MFGLGVESDRAILHPVRVRLGPGRIVAFIGPSGSGKSTALGLIESRYAPALSLDCVQLPPDAALIDAVAPHAKLSDALRILSSCALAEVPLWLRPCSQLSDGQRFRARLARAIGESDGAGAAPLIIDEFCSGLHGRAARAIAYNLRRLATERRLSVVVATTRTDVLADLQPDTLVTLSERGESSLTHRRPRRRPISLWRRFRICEGVKADYDAFARMHYRHGDELGFVDRVFVLRDRVGQAMGVVVYAHSPPELALRNACTAGKFKGGLDRLNREIRILRRLVIHPDLRGCGVGHRFVRRTLPRVGTRYVECLAAMGAINPVFEKAGMKRIGTCRPPRERARLLSRLAELDADPSAADFEMAVCRRPSVRDVALRLVQQWYKSTTARGEHRAQRQSPQMLARICRGLVGCEPVYYLWRRKKKHEGTRK